MKCPKCSKEGNNIIFSVIDHFVIIKMVCGNGHLFGKKRIMSSLELKKLKPFRSWNDTKHKLFNI